MQGAVLTAAANRFGSALIDGSARRLIRSGPAALDAAGEEVSVVVRSSFDALVRQRGVALLLLLYSSDLCCSGSTWRCDPCETLHPLVETLAQRFNGGGAVDVAKMDVHTNDLTDDVLPVPRLPCLKLFNVDGVVVDVPHELYADPTNAVRDVSSFLRKFPLNYSCPRTPSS